MRVVTDSFALGEDIRELSVAQKPSIPKGAVEFFGAAIHGHAQSACQQIMEALVGNLYGDRTSLSTLIECSQGTHELEGRQATLDLGSPGSSVSPGVSQNDRETENSELDENPRDDASAARTDGALFVTMDVLIP